MNREEKYQYWLCSIRGLGFFAVQKLYDSFMSAEAVYRASDKEIFQLNFLKDKEKKLIVRAKNDEEWKKEWDIIRQKKIKCIMPFHESYPDVFHSLYQPPKKLFIKGKAPSSKCVSIGIVGARNCTPYGRDMARLFGYRLAESGVQIISGMALGIDGWSHQGALEAGGDTFAVLGSGVEVCYPTRHRKLYESILMHGGILSEFPIYAQAKPAFFPMRNRIISALSNGILVVEAREKSGSLITADAALEQGKDVFVIPGRIGDELSVGCNRLIRQGAIPVLSPDDILSYYRIEKKNKMEPESGIEKNILEYMEIRPVYVDEISEKLQVSQTELMKCILKLKEQGYIEEIQRNCFMKKT